MRENGSTIRVNCKDVEGITIGVKASDLAGILSLANNYRRIRDELLMAQKRIHNMRIQLAQYQKICERMKNTVSSDTGHPQENETISPVDARAVVVVDE